MKFQVVIVLHRWALLNETEGVKECIVVNFYCQTVIEEKRVWIYVLHARDPHPVHNVAESPVWKNPVFKGIVQPKLKICCFSVFTDHDMVHHVNCPVIIGCNLKGQMVKLEIIWSMIDVLCLQATAVP